MDGRGGFEVLCALEQGADVVVDFAPGKYNRVTHSDASLEAGVEARWQAALKRNATMFNGLKFRLAGIVVCGASGALTLRLGLTDYRTFQGTHGVERPLATFGAPSLASPLGNTIIVETADSQVVFLHRAGAVGEGSGTAVLPGGHPEPGEVGIAEISGESTVAGARVREELWEAAWREVVEEVFVFPMQIGPPDKMRCLGLVARASDRKACQVFHMRANVPASAVKQQYLMGNVRMEESCAVILVPCSKLREVYNNGKVQNLRLMPECMGALKLWLDLPKTGES